MRLLVLEGDGIGPEIVGAAVVVAQALDRRFGLGLEFEHGAFGFAAIHSHGSALPAETVERARGAAGVVCGPHDSVAYPPPHDALLSPAGALRKALDLYANIRPARVRPGVPAHVPAMDLVVCRENTEGFYADRAMYAGAGELMPTPDVALSVRKVTRGAATRIGEAGFRLARGRRRRVTIMHKANVLHLTDGLFRDAVCAVGERYPDVAVNEVLADAMFALVVRRPADFDVVVTSNLYGDFLSDLTSELAGGLGVGGSINASETHCMAQAAHGSAPDIAGRDVANPTAMIVSVAMLLEWLGVHRDRPELEEAARFLDTALDAQLADPGGRTPDLGGTLGTAAFARSLAERIAEG